MADNLRHLTLEHHSDTLEGIEKYLASDLVKGIVKEYAARLVLKVW